MSPMQKMTPASSVKVFGRNGKSLLTALYAFGVSDTISFFEQHGLTLKIERGGRVFPERGNAGDVQKVLDRFISESGVELITSCTVRKLHSDDNKMTLVETYKGELFSQSIYSCHRGTLLSRNRLYRRWLSMGETIGSSSGHPGTRPGSGSSV